MRLRFPRTEYETLLRLFERTDVLHLHGIWPPSNWPAFWPLAARTNLPVVVSLHGMLSDWAMTRHGLRKKAYLHLLGNKLLRSAARIHATARAEVDRSETYLRDAIERVNVLPLPIDLTEFRGAATDGEATADLADGDAIHAASAETIGIPAKDFLVLFLGRVVPKKNPDVAIEALAALLADGFECTLAIAGGGSPRYRARLTQLCNSLGVSARVRFLGFVPESVRTQLFKRADVFVLPTMMENFGYTLVEALASGTPVITTRGADLWAELQASGGARIVELNPNDFAEAIAPLVRDPQIAREMGHRGREWALKRFEEGPLARQYESMYQDAIREKLSQPAN